MTEQAQTAKITEVRDVMAASVTGDEVHIVDSLVVSAASGMMKAQDSLILVGAFGSLEGGTVLLTPQAALLGGLALGGSLALLRRLLRRS
jgi:hypothetical protein